MTEFSDDEVPLPSLEDFFDDTVDDLEVSLGELSIEGYVSHWCDHMSFSSTFVLQVTLKFRCVVDCFFAVYLIKAGQVLQNVLFQS